MNAFIHSFILAFVVGGLGFEFCVFVASWRHALRSEWPFIIISSSRQAAHGPVLTKHNISFNIRISSRPFYARFATP